MLTTTEYIDKAMIKLEDLIDSGDVTGGTLWELKDIRTLLYLAR